MTSPVEGIPDCVPDRLVRVAAAAIHGSPAYGPASMRKGTAAASAILRELADGLFEELLNRVEPGMVVRPNVIPEVLRSWAAKIEEGGRG